LTLYFTQGHGEKDLNNPQQDGLNHFVDSLEKENYVVKPVTLLTGGKIPDDAAVIACVGPTHAFQSSEEALLKDWLQKGGKFVLCIDPTVRAGLDSLLKDFGVKLGNDLVVDPTSYAFPEVSALIPQYAYHAIVEKLSNDHIPVIMPGTRSIQKIDPVLKGVTQTIFMQTTDKGWGDTELKDKKLRMHPGDLKGPVPVAMACEWTPADASKKTRVVVYGNSNFFTNQLFGMYGNLDVGLNTFSWAAGEENKITIHPKEEDMRVLALTNVGANLVYYLAVWIMPLAVLAIGGFIWYRRRSL
jgi:ABC-type uncharacterized transport system involved in gliding motility auxiliary subunit